MIVPPLILFLRAPAELRRGADRRDRRADAEGQGCQTSCSRRSSTFRPHGPESWRDPLARQIERGAGATLTLVSAPAGFGKTTLMAEWFAAASGDARAAWLSLDRRQRPGETFWTYVVEALDRAVTAIDIGARSLLAAGRARSTRS